jgi:hypothetical protein
MIFLRFPRKMPEYHLKGDHDRFIPHPCKSLFSSRRISWRNMASVADSVVKQNVKPKGKPTFRAAKTLLFRIFHNKVFSLSKIC